MGRRPRLRATPAGVGRRAGMPEISGTRKASHEPSASFSPDEPRWTPDPRATQRAADARRDAWAAEGAAVPGAIDPPKETTRASIIARARDVLAREQDVARGGGPASVRALTEARTAWCEEASRSGLRPPGPSFDPARATDAELGAAALWTRLGGALPVHAFGDGGAAYRKELGLAMLARSPMALRIAPDSPELRAACQRELTRLGKGEPCRADDTVARLAERIDRARLETAAMATRASRAMDARTTYIGASGRVGPEEVVAAADFEAYLGAMMPGSATGSILAASWAGDLSAMQRAGALGNALEDLAGPFARGKTTDHPGVNRATDSHRP